MFAEERSVSSTAGETDMRRIGVWSARLVLLWTSVFALTMLVELFGRSTGFLPFLASLLLAPSFVVMMTAVHDQAPPSKRIWSQIGLLFAVMYAVLVGLVYYVQLTALRGANDPYSPFLYTPGSVFFSINMLGYAFMCLSTWFAAMVFAPGEPLSAWIRRLFILHGWLVIPTLIAPALMTTPSGDDESLTGYVALLFWCLIFIPLSYLVLRYFRTRVGPLPAQRSAP